MGNYEMPLPFYNGLYVTNGFWYSTDGIEKYQCIKSGNPESITDKEYFTKSLYNDGYDQAILDIMEE